MNLKNIDWGVGTFILVYHLLLFTLLPIYLYFTTPSIGLIVFTVVLILFSGIGIGAGYHRFYAHKSYKLNKVAEFFMLLFGTISIEGSALTWSSDHRLHHRHVDTKKDPYNIKEGFWHAHILWLFKKKHGVEEKVVSDLLKNKLVMFQHKHYLLLTILSNLFFITLMGYLFKDLAGAFVLGFLLRVFIFHHMTWFINSLAHYWGVQPYSKEHSAVNNWFISFLTFGEGYHNYHHTFESDYRTGIRWYQYDSSKYVIWILSKLGLAYDLNRMNNTQVKRKLLHEDKKMLLERIGSISYVNHSLLERKVHELSDKINNKITEFHVLANKFKESKRSSSSKSIRLKLKKLNSSLRADFSQWGKLCDSILKLKSDV